MPVTRAAVLPISRLNRAALAALALGAFACGSAPSGVSDDECEPTNRVAPPSPDVPAPPVGPPVVAPIDPPLKPPAPGVVCVIRRDGEAAPSPEGIVPARDP